MYRYDEFDHAMVAARVEEFRGQVERRLSGALTEDEFKPLRLMNGVYLQLHAYMLRVAIPYGQLSPAQLRMLAHIARAYDRGYGHFTTRQNIQYNWPALKDIPAILEDLASVEMHCIQTSGNCIRNVTSDHLAGAAADEIEDPRPWCELIRQWSTFHPEFTYLPRKFKIAVTAAEKDRAAVRVHDIGLHMRRNASGEAGFEVIVGGGQGRTPYVGATIRDWLAKDELLPYLAAILRVYNRHGRRDNIYKARIKILVSALGEEAFARQVEAEYAAMREAGEAASIAVPGHEVERIAAYFAPPAFDPDAPEADWTAERASHPAFADWLDANVEPHKAPGYAIANISLKPIGKPPGDATAEQMEAAAAIAERYGLGDIRVTHIQNLVIPHVRQADLFEVWRALDAAGLATANLNQATDLICCPGLDYCNLANARSIPVAQAIQERLDAAGLARRAGAVHINISGCINACGHHHVGHIGVLGVDKKGEEFYQITLGGRADEKAAIGAIAGRGLSEQETPAAIERALLAYLELRSGDHESFIETLERVGHEPFKDAIYAAG